MLKILFILALTGNIYDLVSFLKDEKQKENPRKRNRKIYWKFFWIVLMAACLVESI